MSNLKCNPFISINNHSPDICLYWFYHQCVHFKIVVFTFRHYNSVLLIHTERKKFYKEILMYFKTHNQEAFFLSHIFFFSLKTLKTFWYIEFSGVEFVVAYSWYTSTCSSVLYVFCKLAAGSGGLFRFMSNPFGKSIQSVLS